MLARGFDRRPHRCLCSVHSTRVDAVTVHVSARTLLEDRPVMRIALALFDRDVTLAVGEHVIGRGVGCDVVIDDKTVSRIHAALVVRDDGVVVRDLGSRNGTWVNGIRIGADRRLRAGDRVHIGAVTMIVRGIDGEKDTYDDGWLAVQAALLVKESTAARVREADEIVFRLAEAFESRLLVGSSFGADVTDAAFAAMIDYATARGRPGWVRWATAMHAKLGLALGPAVRRAMEDHPTDPRLRSSGTVPAGSPTSTSIVPKSSVRERTPTPALTKKRTG